MSGRIYDLVIIYEVNMVPEITVNTKNMPSYRSNCGERLLTLFRLLKLRPDLSGSFLVNVTELVSGNKIKVFNLFESQLS